MTARLPKVLALSALSARLHVVAVPPVPTTRLLTPRNRLLALFVPSRVRVEPLPRSTRPVSEAPESRIRLLPEPLA